MNLWVKQASGPHGNQKSGAESFCLGRPLFLFYGFFLSVCLLPPSPSFTCKGEGNGTPLQYFAWKIPWTEEPGRLQSMGSRRVGHDWATSLSLFTFMHWRRKWQHTPVFLPGESQGRRAWWAAVYGVAQSRTRLTRLSSSSSRQDYPIKNVLHIFLQRTPPAAQWLPSPLSQVGECDWNIWVSVYHWAIQLYAGGSQLTGLRRNWHSFRNSAWSGCQTIEIIPKKSVDDAENRLGHLHIVSKSQSRPAESRTWRQHSHLAAHRSHLGSFKATDAWILYPEFLMELVWKTAWSSAVLKAPLLNLMCKRGGDPQKGLGKPCVE